MTTAYIIYRGNRVDVKVNSTFQGSTGLMANVEAVTGFPFLSSDVASQGLTFGAWNCNGYRVRADFVMVEADPEDYAPHPVNEAQDIERGIDSATERIEDLLSGNPNRVVKYVTKEKMTPKPYSSYKRFRSEPLSAEELENMTGGDV